MFINLIQIGGWVNGNLYVPTSESLGILPIPDDIRDLSGMMKYIPSLDSGQKYSYLASRQGTRKPILPVHTPEERTLFRFFLHHEPLFTPCAGEPNWRAAVKVWNSKADREDAATDGISLSSI
ncbi:hypothetical protein AGABI1DRAFT_134593 [Agaricus bisporus var. burnettii JB137-S8]|uniref:Uncharacterized protein n=1 Tax=Agaricus bisporus var. burnettii (strain JB137-S8 / ATCC MYA-4627 / FGSC 10392) TaxID=597362 RepID=K5XGJ6_AGABU|nr:uncharacterized protein AGABI1DRAFT_134593 [Agaricus bisporus var. burnettii JB137-S8]EKM73525.1 hypothetical protein AGABI1DRAFT_134593 [Agaricus bisporus var. burnettii JB137-S8]